jgi:hypothetical protein
MADDNAGRDKKDYQAPKITMISLRPEEAVLGNCKNPSGGPSGPVGSTCSSTGACMTFGS